MLNIHLPQTRWKAEFPGIFMVKNKFYHFSVFIDIDVTSKLLVLILVDMDRGDQDLYIGTK